MVMRETTATTCGFPGDRDETLIAYLYNDIDPAGRAVFEAHLPACARCRDDVAALGAVRTQLSAWSPPSFVAPGRSVASPSLQPPASRWWQQVPAWAQVAAAMVFLGVGAGLANLDVHYDRNGLSVRTGWMDSPQPSVVGPQSPDVGRESSAVSPQPSAEAAPWRADLAALERQLRTEFRANPSNQAKPVNVANAVNPEVLGRVKAMVDESEKREQRELALRVAEVLRDVNAQRQADLVKIDRTLGVLQNNTGVEVMRNRQMLNYLVTASQQRPQ
jgi:hypothetical protein